MSHTPHELAEEFPDSVEKISALKQSDAHFAKLADAYHDINRAVHRAETDVEPTDEAHMQVGQIMVGSEVFPFGYAYQWWVPAGGDGVFSAIGKRIWLSMVERLSIYLYVICHGYPWI